MTELITDRFAAYHADTVEVSKSLPDNAVDFSIFSPPFASLYTYSNSPRDIGNVKDDAEFAEHMSYLIPEQFRVMAPGRVLAIHCMDMPTSKERDGYIGVRDFPGDLIRMYQSAGFIFHSRVTIWKNPVTAMQRTHALGLLHKTVMTDSAMCRNGLADYMVMMRKPGVNTKPITHWANDPRTQSIKGDPHGEEFQVDRWQRYASPVWMDIDPGDTLQYTSAREHDDERHICPLQLEPIRRCVDLWSRPDDLVWSPFMGIGSEGYIALQKGRRFVGAELKASYYQQAIKNLAEAATVKQESLFGAVPATAAYKEESDDDIE